MTVPILVMTPVRSFGELVQQALQETGQYRITLVNDKKQVLDRIGANGYPVAVLDFDLDPDPSDLLGSLGAMDPELRIVILKEKTGSSSLNVKGFRGAKVLEESFYLPDLLQALEEIIGDLKGSFEPFSALEKGHFPSKIHQERKGRTPHPAPGWLKDVEQAAHHLTRLSIESEIQASLITCNYEIWAYAGHLPHPALEELAGFIRQYWSSEDDSDFARFIRLEATNREYVLYATGMGETYVLALAFDTETPFTKIRSQVRGLAARLATSSQAIFTIEKKSDEVVEVPTGKSLPFNPASPAFGDGADPAEAPYEWQPIKDISKSHQAFFDDLTSIAAPLDLQAPPADQGEQALPGSFPREKSNASPEMPLTPAGDPTPVDDEDRAFGAQTQPLRVAPRDDRAGGGPVEWGSYPPFSQQLPADFFDETIPNYLKQTLPLPVPDYLQETLPTPVAGTTEMTPEFYSFTGDSDTLNPWYPQLTYAFVLLPRLPQHHLVGELAHFLNQFFLQLGKRFEWHLVHLAIRPHYLHWVAVIPPSISAGTIAWQIREEITGEIFTRFPRLAQENPSGEFWAEGYLIVNGRDPLPHSMVDDFITRTRLRQQGSRSRSGYKS